MMNIIYFTKLNFIKGSENESAEESDDGDDDEEDEDGQKSLASLGLSDMVIYFSGQYIFSFSGK